MARRKARRKLAYQPGDADSFAAFYRAHEDLVLRFFLRRTRSAEVTADLTAETFARALAGGANYDSRKGAPAAWLIGIARHVMVASLQAGRVEDQARKQLGMTALILDSDAMARVDELAAANSALDALPHDQRRAVVGRVLEDRSYAQLAAELQCSQSVVRQRVSRGLRTLRAELESQS